MSMYAFTPESATVYWLSPDHQEELMENHHTLEAVEKVTAMQPKETKAEQTQTMEWPCSTKPKNLYEKVHEGCNYATVEAYPEKKEKKEMTWEDYKAELDEWLMHKRKRNYADTPKHSKEHAVPRFTQSTRCGSFFKTPEEAQKMLVLLIAVIFGFILGRSW